MINYDTAFGIHETMLKARSHRLDILASNIANAATPGYKAKDIDFSDILQSNLDSADLLATHDAHLPGNRSGATGLKFRIPVQPSADGNTVEMATEQTAFAENSLHYQTTLAFLNGRISTLMRALKGE
jgi:flagellar basal-body rod protein FlgB